MAITGRGLVMAFSIAALAATAAQAGEIVRIVGQGRLDVDATAVPLIKVLEAVTRQAGASLTCVGRQPGQLLTITLRGVSPAEAVARLLEGTGVGYVLRTDPSGARILALELVESSAPAGAAPARAARPEEETPGPLGEEPGQAAPPTQEPAPAEAEPAAIESGVGASPDSSWPPGMAPIGPVDSAADSPPGAGPSGVDSPAVASGTGEPLPAPPVATPGQAGPAGAPPPGMRLTGPPPTTPPPQPQ